MMLSNNKIKDNDFMAALFQQMEILIVHAHFTQT